MNNVCSALRTAATERAVQVPTRQELEVPGRDENSGGYHPGLGTTAQPVVTDEERVARAVLTYITQPGDLLAGAMARALGAVRALEAVRSASLAGFGDLPGFPDPARALARLRERLGAVPPRKEIRRQLGGRFRLVCPGDPEWPGGLDALGDAAPAALWVTGAADLGSACRRSVTVTGARAATAYGAYLAAEFSASLAGRGVTVIAGGSFGIDAAAHRGALSAGGTTIAVAAGGPDIPYPAAHEGLFGEIAGHGVIVSEAPPGTHVNRLRFLVRNRVMAALAAATLIVEAGTRSGALTAARHARDLGRPVAAVPGPVTSELSAGCNGLIRAGHAVLVTSASDVADTLPLAG